MKASTAAIAQAVDGRDQTVKYVFHIDLSKQLGGAYADVQFDVAKFNLGGDLVSDAPDGTRIEDGYTAYQLSFTCAGRIGDDETKTAAWFFARYPFPASDGTLTPLAWLDAFAAPVWVTWTPTGSDAVEIFFGEIDNYQQDSDGRVVFTCIDGRNQLRAASDVPVVITPPPFNAGLTSEFAMDLLLRTSSQGRISSWPAQRPQCVLAAGMRASVWPEVGTLDASSNFKPSLVGAPSFTPGAFGSAVTGNTTRASDVITVAYRLAAPLTTTVFVEAWVTGVKPGGGLVQIDLGAASAYLRVQLQGNGMYLVYPDGTYLQWDITIADSPHYIAAALTIPAASATGGITGTLYYDGTTKTVTGKTITRNSDAWDRLSVKPSINATVEAVQATTEATPTPSYPFTPRAVLDPSLNPLQIIPPMAGDPWQTIQVMAGAELGVAGFFGGRVFRFYNRRTLIARPITRTLTSEGALEAAGVGSDRAGVVNRCRVGYTAWNFATAASTIYDADQPIRVPRRGTVTVQMQLDQYAFGVDTTAAVMPDGSTTIASWYRASTDQYGNAKHPGGLSFAFSQTAPDTISVTIVNSSGLDAWLVSPADYLDVPVGTPLLRIAGKVATPANEVIVDYQWPTPELGGAKQSRFGEVLCEPSSSPWRQDPDATLDLVKFIVQEGYQPRADLTDLAIGPDPRTEPGDNVHLIDSARTGVDDYARVYAFQIDYDAEDPDGGVTYSMTISARALGPPGAWLLGVPGRSELNATTWLRGIG